MKLIILCLLFGLAAALRRPEPCVNRHDHHDERCARPAANCVSQKKPLSCNRWHGCIWNKKARKKCQADRRCDFDKPLPRVCEAPATDSPNSVDPPAVFRGNCAEVPFGCKRGTRGECPLYEGCKWDDAASTCVRNYSVCPERFCTRVGDLPGHRRCPKVRSPSRCRRFPCCGWRGNSGCVRVEPPLRDGVVRLTSRPTAAPTPTVPCSSFSGNKWQCNRFPTKCEWFAQSKKRGNRCRPIP